VKHFGRGGKKKGNFAFPHTNRRRESWRVHDTINTVFMEKCFARSCPRTTQTNAKNGKQMRGMTSGQGSGRGCPCTILGGGVGGVTVCVTYCESQVSEKRWPDVLQMDRENKQQWMTGETLSSTTRFYSNGRNSYRSLFPCACRSSKMTNYSSFSFFSLVPFNVFDFGLYCSKTFERDVRTNFWNRLVLLVHFVENFRQLTKLLVGINLHSWK
jgi:hypothetical protein